MRIGETVVAIGDQPEHAMDRKVTTNWWGWERGETVVPLRLTFKLNTDDVHDAPSLAIGVSRHCGIGTGRMAWCWAA